MRRHPHYALIGPYPTKLGVEYKIGEVVWSYIFDLALLTARLLVEFDRPHHDGSTAIEYDQEKTRAAERLGWRVIRVVVPDGDGPYPVSVLEGLPLH